MEHSIPPTVTLAYVTKHVYVQILTYNRFACVVHVKAARVTRPNRSRDRQRPSFIPIPRIPPFALFYEASLPDARTQHYMRCEDEVLSVHVEKRRGKMQKT